MKLIRHPLLALASCALLSLATAAAQAAAVAYTLDPAHTQVEVRWSHLGYSHPAANLEQVEGVLHWDADDITRSSVTVRLPLAGLDTHVPALDAVLASEAWLDAARHDAITFVSTGVRRMAAQDRLQVAGNLSLHGITRPVVLDVAVNRSGSHPMLEVPAVGFDASTRIKRSDFGLVAGLPDVGDELEIRITVEALEAQGYAKAMKALSGAAKH